MSKTESIYLVECIFNQPIYDIIVVNLIMKRVFFIQVSQQKYSSHTKPSPDYQQEVVTKLQLYHNTVFDPFYVYATIRMQNYTIDH